MPRGIGLSVKANNTKKVSFLVMPVSLRLSYLVKIGAVERDVPYSAAFARSVVRVRVRNVTNSSAAVG
jgi:hypothetical protein